MEQNKILNDITSLPIEAQKQVIDFIAFLRQRYKVPEKKNQKEKTALVQEPFIGIWKDRKDMEDSVKWVRDARKTHWGHKI